MRPKLFAEPDRPGRKFRSWAFCSGSGRDFQTARSSGLVDQAFCNATSSGSIKEALPSDVGNPFVETRFAFSRAVDKILSQAVDNL
jgi:hypothetical protein